MRVFLFCAGLAAFLSALSSPLAAVAAEKAIWGPVERPGGGSAFDVYRDLGVDTYQATLRWADIAPRPPADPGDPTDPAYRWPKSVDRAIAEATRHGIRVALLVSTSPSWANGGREPLFVPRASEYADFLTAASRRYPYVRRWMIWGEPNSSNTFRPNRRGSSVGPRAYARILDAAYGALKRVSRRNVVIGGMSHTGGTVRPAQFLRLMRLPSGRPPRLDWYGHNPFPIGFPRLRKRPVPGGFRDISDLDTFTMEIARAYTHRCEKASDRRCGRRPKLWLSEFTVQSDRGSRIFARSVSRAGQARWLRAAYEIADRLPSIAGLGWLSFVDDSQGQANWGLLTPTGERKPSFFAYEAAPSRAFRPTVKGPRRLRSTGRSRRAVVLIRPRAAGTVVVAIRSRRGRLVDRAVRRLRAGALWRARLSVAARESGRYAVVVDAPRGERVRRKLRLD